MTSSTGFFELEFSERLKRGVLQCLESVSSSLADSQPLIYFEGSGWSVTPGVGHKIFPAILPL